jgi:D-3-phosphoglycerate dehydrogenase / 2-oxoglutarate reductase
LKNVLLLETIATEALELLKANSSITILTTYAAESLDHILAKYQIHAIITRGKGQITQDLLQACPQLQVVARCGVGLDNVDVPAATAKKIPVINAPGSNAATIAEHSMALMLMLQRNMYEAVTKVKSGHWQHRNTFVCDELHNKTLGILGMGNIGQKVAKLAEAFGMKIVYWSKPELNISYQYLPLDQVLKTADIVSIHLPYLPDTHHLINKDRLALMQSHALLINTARGAIVDENALFNSLQNQQLGGFGADVLNQEPPDASNPLLGHHKALITAHVGSLTATTYSQMCLYTVQNVLAVLNNKTPEPRSVFNREALVY